MTDEEPYSNIRSILGHFIGSRLLDVTQHDQDEYALMKKGYVMLFFENGDWIRVPLDFERETKGMEYSKNGERWGD